MAIANRNVTAAALREPRKEHQGYGAFSYTPSPYYAGRLPRRVAERFYEARERNGRYLPTFYSYGTPIAWLDGDTWVIPDVSYSITTSHHQSHLWQLPKPVYIPSDCGPLGYERLLSGLDTYSRWSGLKSPGATDPRWR